MKKIGLIGGMSWRSTIEYYRILNETAAQLLGSEHSAKILLYNVDFADITDMQKRGAWEEAGQALASAAQSLETAGAELVLIGAVTMHKVASTVQAAVSIPLIHIVDVTAEAIIASGISKVGLLGTRYTMEDDFVIDRLHKLGIDPIVPQPSDRELLHRVIFEELAKGVISQSSKEEFITIIDQLSARGAEGIILGCTEISLLIHPDDSRLPLFDTTSLHAVSAINAALAK